MKIYGNNFGVDRYLVLKLNRFMSNWYNELQNQ